LHLGHWLIPEAFFPGALFPIMVFLLLYSYPWTDKLISLSIREHNVLRLPRQQPFNSPFGCSLLMFVLIFLIIGGCGIRNLPPASGCVRGAESRPAERFGCCRVSQTRTLMGDVRR